MVAEGRAFPIPPPYLLGLGIGVGKVRTYYYSTTLRGRGGRRSYKSIRLGEGRGVPKRHNLGTKHRTHNVSRGFAVSALMLMMSQNS